MKARYISDMESDAWVTEPGSWTYRSVRLNGRSQMVIVACLPNGQRVMIDDRWKIVGGPEMVTITPSIWVNPGQGKEKGEWHGWLTNGHWREA